MNGPVTLPRGAGRAAAMERLARRRSRVVSVLSGSLFALYFALMGLFAFNKPLLGATLRPGLTAWLVLGPGFIAAACLIGLGYVAWAGAVFDPAAERLADADELRDEAHHDQ